MNEKFLKFIIEKVKDEECAKHRKKASFKVKGETILIYDTCCTEFYNEISEKIRIKINQEMFKL